MLNKSPRETKSHDDKVVGALNMTQLVLNPVVSSSTDNRSVLNSPSNIKYFSGVIKSEENMKYYVVERTLVRSPAEI